jgi:hypothetical protein
MVGLILPIAVMFYYVDIGWNSVRTNGENLYTMREVGVDPIHQAVPRSPAVDGATKMLKEGAAKGFKEVEAYRGVKAPG